MRSIPSKILALWCWYHGAPFRGYQSQPQGPTVQDALVHALSRSGIDGTPISAGRTDLGVHARMQIVTVRVPRDTTLSDLERKLRTHLPEGLGIEGIKEAPHKFHPQWHCSGKEYRYRIAIADVPEWSPVSWKIDVDIHALRETLIMAVGARDFQAFHEKSSAIKLRTISQIDVVPVAAGLIDIRVVGTGFGRYMIRYLVGSSVRVARGEMDRRDFEAAILHAKPIAGFKAPAKGLILWETHYPFALFGEDERRNPCHVPPSPPFFLAA